MVTLNGVGKDRKPFADLFNFIVDSSHSVAFRHDRRFVDNAGFYLLLEKY